MRAGRPLAAIAVCGLLLVAATTSSVASSAASESHVRAPDTQGAFPGANGMIAFVSWDGSDSEIYTVNADGTGLTQLTFNSVEDYDPAWNPVGTKIAWASNGDVSVMNADGSGQHVINGASNSYEVSWSPTGRRLVVSRDAPNGDYDLYTMKRNGTDVRRITRTAYGESNPVWSPVGKRIGFDAPATGGADLVITIEPDGRHRRILTSGSGSAYMGGWSPNGKRIVYQSNEGGDYELYRMSARGANQTQLTFNTWDDEAPTYSPDGTRLAWSDNYDGDYEVVQAPLTSLGTASQLTNNSFYDLGVDWQPV